MVERVRCGGRSSRLKHFKKSSNDRKLFIPPQLTYNPGGNRMAKKKIGFRSGFSGCGTDALIQPVKA